MIQSDKQIMENLWWSGVEAVRGYAAVQKIMTEHAGGVPDLIIAVGKAAGDMALGARDALGQAVPTIVATKYEHASNALKDLVNCRIYESAHPIPDENSLKAGNAILKAVQELEPTSSLLLLVSGGASSLVEVLQPELDLNDLARLNEGFMAQGLDIHQINAERKKISKIKAGQLLEAFKGASAQVIAVSDVEGDNIDVIGSGIGAYHGDNPNITVSIAASNQVARQAIQSAAIALDLTIIENTEILYGDVAEVADRVFDIVGDGPNGLYIFGGEPTCVLPDRPGRGGRNQHLALYLANLIRGRNNLSILVAGTDGTDGPTGDAGGLVDGDTVQTDITAYLQNADSGSYLDQRDALFTTGPTGTNVMDIMLVLKTA